MQFGVHWDDSIDKAVQQKALDGFAQLILDGGSQIEVVPKIDVWRWKKTIW